MLYNIFYGFYDGWTYGHSISYSIANETEDTVFIKYENTTDRIAEDSLVRNMGYNIDTDAYTPIAPSHTFNYFTLSTTGSLHFKYFFTYSRYFKPPYKHMFVKYRNHVHPISLENQKYYTYSSVKDTIRFFFHIKKATL